MNSAHANHDFTATAAPSSDRELVADEDLLFDIDSAIVEDQTPQRHTIRIGDIGLVLPANELSELIERVAVCSMPNTRSWFNGVTAIRGNMVPVFDLHDLFSIEHSTAKRRLIAVGQNETAAAFWVDDFPRLIKFGDEDVTTMLPSVPDLVREHAQQYYQIEEQTWVEWDFKSFFAALGEQL